MCFTSGHTSDERGSSLTDGLRAKQQNVSGSKRNKSKKPKPPASRLSTKEYAGAKKSGVVAKVVSLAKAASPSRTDFKGSQSKTAFTRLGSSAEIKGMQNAEEMTNSLSPTGVGSNRFVSKSFTSDSKGSRSQRFVSNSGQIVPKEVPSDQLGSNSEIARNDVQSERFLRNSGIARTDVKSDRFPSDSGSTAKLDKKTFISAQFMSKVNTKQVKGAMKGMGKELRRAASTVGEKLPNYSTKKKNKEDKDRRELLEPQKPQVRDPDEIKIAYGHAPAVGTTNQAAMVTREKLHERGEKISALQRKTTDLEADAANFSSLAHELAKKMEAKKCFIRLFQAVCPRTYAAWGQDDYDF